MISTPSNEALIACDQVSRLPRWVDIDKMIAAEIAAVTDRMLHATDTAKLHECRGRALALQEFQQAVRDARSTLAKLGVTAPI